MSRFGLRKKLKSIVSKQSGPSYKTFEVTFILPNGTKQIVHAEEKYNLLMASEALPSPISTGRRAGGTCPDGLCGLCRVEVLDQCGLTAMKERELESLDNYVKGTPHEGREREPGEAYSDNTRLACHVKIVGDGGIVQINDLVDFEDLRGEI
jgi:ferredoxin